MRKAGRINAAISISAPHIEAKTVRIIEASQLQIEENLLFRLLIQPDLALP
jgi:hypothetical protein